MKILLAKSCPFIFARVSYIPYVLGSFRISFELFFLLQFSAVWIVEKQLAYIKIDCADVLV